ncbi:MAG: hypothetical protein GXW99_12135 [Clostridiales bacterium]|nr:hypothetical protein [Clostridiales bacterium]
MGFFQRIGNALARFMYGRNGADQLGLTMIWTAILLDIANWIVRNQTVDAIIGAAALILTIWAIFRMFSRNLYKRREENTRFLNKLWYPVKRSFANAKIRSRDKEHKYFTCSNCHTMCRVPKGKGNIVITCPKCGTEIHGKS